MFYSPIKLNRWMQQQEQRTAVLQSFLPCQTAVSGSWSHTPSLQTEDCLSGSWWHWCLKDSETKTTHEERRAKFNIYNPSLPSDNTFILLVQAQLLHTISSCVQGAKVLQLLRHFVLDGLQLGRLVCQFKDVHEGFIVTAGVPNLHESIHVGPTATLI